jgi:hypothetical protein
MSISSAGKSYPSASVMTNVTMGKPVIVGPETAQAKKLLTSVAKQVRAFNEMPIEQKLGTGALGNLMSAVGAPAKKAV